MSFIKDEIMDAVGDAASDLTDKALDNLEQWFNAKKDALDKETRRQLRVFWGAACVVCFLCGLFFREIIGLL